MKKEIVLDVVHAPTEKQREFCELLNEIRSFEDCSNEDVTPRMIHDKVCMMNRHLRNFTPELLFMDLELVIKANMASFDAGRILVRIRPKLKSLNK